MLLSAAEVPSRSSVVFDSSAPSFICSRRSCLLSGGRLLASRWLPAAAVRLLGSSVFHSSRRLRGPSTRRCVPQVLSPCFPGVAAVALLSPCTPTANLVALRRAASCC